MVVPLAEFEAEAVGDGEADILMAVAVSSWDISELDW